MQSPFPGMDPYIEASGVWADFHLALIVEIRKVLARALPEHYVVRAGERSYLVLVEAEGKKKHPFVPDVSVTVPRQRKKTPMKGETAVADAIGDEPHVLRAFIEDEHREPFVEIYEAEGEQRLVTTIEILSPSNKRADTLGWEVYQRKRQSLLLGDVNLVELDLLRGGQRMPMLDPWPDSPYTLMMARARKPYACLVWEGHFQRPLPTIRVPLAKPDADISLSLQPLVDTIYQEARYDQTIDYKQPLTPPLKEEEAAGLQQRLQERSGGKGRKSG